MLHAFYQNTLKISPVHSWTTINCQNDWLRAPGRTSQGSIHLPIFSVTFVPKIIKIDLCFVRVIVRQNSDIFLGYSVYMCT